MSGTDGFRGGSGDLRELTRNPLQSTLEWRRTRPPPRLRWDALIWGKILGPRAKPTWSRASTKLCARAFPWLQREAFSHQKRFHLQVGRAGVTVDGEVASRVDARADVIVSHDDRPLAVLELKRPGEKLTREDEQQGLSYAALHHPHPPLVVVTNGSDVKVLDSYSGEEWKPEGAPEQRLAALFANASRAAALDLSKAVEVLLGSRSEVWVAPSALPRA